MTPKLIISSLVGIAAIGGGVTGGYCYFKSSDTEKTQTSETQSTPTTQKPHTQANPSQPVQESVGETPVQAPVLNPPRAHEGGDRGASGSDAGRGATGSQTELSASSQLGEASVPRVVPSVVP